MNAQHGFDVTEKAASQIPALQVLASLGFEILSQVDADARRGKLSRVLLEDVLAERILAINSFSRYGTEHRFNDGDAAEAIRALRPAPDKLKGLIGTNQEIYDTLVLGVSVQKVVDGDAKSHTIRFIDWETPANNRYHATAEFRVERTGSIETRRCDIVLFVNGIPFVVIENKAPSVEVIQGVSQLIGYQKPENIPALFHYAQLLVAANVSEVRYATAGTPRKFWLTWRDEEDRDADIEPVVNATLSPAQTNAIFSGDFAHLRPHFSAMAAAGPRVITEQDRILYALCRPQRLLDLVRTFTVFDGGVRKVARYQQFFGVRRTLERIKQRDTAKRRRSGVIWHTQGSGKSLTMVMLGKALAFDPAIDTPRLIIVTDRDDLDKQIARTFKACDMQPVRAASGRDLAEKLQAGERLITAIINKFKFAARVSEQPVRDDNLFVLVDESHRSQEGGFAGRMRQMLPDSCFIAFTGTPLLKREKNTFARFGGTIHTYTIDKAVKDGAVVPLLYEGRFVDQKITGTVIDTWFDKLAAGLNDRQKADLRAKFSRMQLLSSTEQALYAKAIDISEHYRKFWQGTGFKAQLVAPSKVAAIRLKAILDDIGHVTSEIIISAPDDREGNDEVDEDSKDVVRAFWAKMMKKYGTEEIYNRDITEAFKGSGDPEILIVVSKLLTGFDAPRNTVLYLCKALKEHNLLQAIARVNRLFDEDGGKEKPFGYIIDYEGLLGELDSALTTYSSFEGYDEADLAGVAQDVKAQVRQLPDRHGDVWDIFREIKNKYDLEAMQEHLADEALRDEFYDRLRAFGRALHIAMGSEKTYEVFSDADLEKFGADWKRFDGLRKLVRIRYQEAVDARSFEPKIRDLLDKHVIAMPAEVIVETVNISDKESLEKVLEETSTSDASKADRIASATKKTITDHIEEDPDLYKAFSTMLEETIALYRQKRMSEKDYLTKVIGIAENVAGKKRTKDVPASIANDETAQAYFGVLKGPIAACTEGVNAEETAAEAAKDIASLISARMIVDFWANDEAQKALMNEIDDYFFDHLRPKGIDLPIIKIDALAIEVLRIARARNP